MSSPETVHILTRPTFGLMTDSQVVARALADDFRVRSFFPQGRNLDLVHRRVGLRIANAFQRGKPARVNIFSEQVMPGWLPLADFNLLIVNQEWCRPETIQLLNHIDLVICKTAYAETIFNTLHRKTALTGFTSLDRFDANVAKDYTSFLHVAGRSRQKGTATLLKVWKLHPEWPQLTVVTTTLDLIPPQVSENIRIISNVLTEDQLQLLQNTAGFHICTSEAEGYGHYIAEAMSCGAIVITTDAPPMNELVTVGRGFLVPYERSKKQSLGDNFYVCPNGLERCINQVLQLNPEERSALSRSARAWFIQNQQDFNFRFKAAIKQLMRSSEVAN